MHFEDQEVLLGIYRDKKEIEMAGGVFVRSLRLQFSDHIHYMGASHDYFTYVMCVCV
jgi:hypothetical protein